MSVDERPPSSAGSAPEESDDAELAVTPEQGGGDDLAGWVVRTADRELARLFQADGLVAELDDSGVRLPQWNARFRCQNNPEEAPCVGPTIVIGVLAEVPDLTAKPILVYQLGEGSLCPTHGFTKAIHNAVLQWHTSVWHVLLNVLRVLRGEAIQPQSEWSQSDPNGEAFKFRAFSGPMLANSTYEGSPEAAFKALTLRLQTWGLFHRVVKPLVANEYELEPDQGVWWVKAYLGRDFGALFGEVKFNNEDSWDGLRTLEQFPWPDEIQGTMTFKQFFVILRGEPVPLPDVSTPILATRSSLPDNLHRASEASPPGRPRPFDPTKADPNECYFKKCPACGCEKVRVLIPRGEDDNGFDPRNFRLFQDRQCTACGRKWTPACPRWAAYGYIFLGAVFVVCACVFVAVTVAREGSKGWSLGIVFGAIPALVGCVSLYYGVGALAGELGRLRMR